VEAVEREVMDEWRERVAESFVGGG
jgi:hypothetical protein